MTAPRPPRPAPFLPLLLFLLSGVPAFPGTDALPVEEDRLLRDIPARSVEEIARLYQRRLGGEGALRDMDSIRLRLNIQRESGDTVRMTVLKKRPDRVRIMFPQNQFMITQGFDGERAWVRQQGIGVDRIREMNPEEATRFIRDAPIEHVLLHADRVGARLEMVGLRRFFNMPCYEIHAHFPDGDRYEFLIDANEFVDRRITRIIKRDGEVTRTEIIPSQFEYVRGILFAFRYIYFINGERDSVVEVEEAAVNPGLLDDAFRMPQSADSAR